MKVKSPNKIMAELISRGYGVSMGGTWGAEGQVSFSPQMWVYCDYPPSPDFRWPAWSLEKEKEDQNEFTQKRRETYQRVLLAQENKPDETLTLIYKLMKKIRDDLRELKSRK